MTGLRRQGIRVHDRKGGCEVIVWKTPRLGGASTEPRKESRP